MTSSRLQYGITSAAEWSVVVQADGVFMSPPWGGPEYTRKGPYDVLTPFPGLPVGLPGLLDVAKTGLRTVSKRRTIAKEGVLAVYLPKNANRAQMAASVPKDAVYYNIVNQWVLQRSNRHEQRKLEAVTMYVWF